MVSNRIIDNGETVAAGKDYGRHVMAQAGGQRRSHASFTGSQQEFGGRQAMGATRADIMKLVRERRRNDVPRPDRRLPRASGRLDWVVSLIGVALLDHATF